MSLDGFSRWASGALTPPVAAGRNGPMTRSVTAKPSVATMWDFMAITKALADENRVRMLLALRGRELCLCQIVELVVLASSTVSKHMSILRQSRLVEGRKTGRWMYYRLAGEGATELVQRTLALVLDTLADDPRAARDAERLREILQIDPQALCETQCAPQPSCGSSRKTSARRRSS